jgi:acyl carrier protein
MSEQETREKLRQWIAKKNGKLAASDLKDDAPLIASRILSSVQLMDLILFIEDLSGREIDVDDLKPAVFTSINTIYANFFGKG